MTPEQQAESRRRAVLAAVLAVKQGFISPDDAISMLGGVIGAGAPPAPAPTGAPAPSPVPDPVATVLAINPAAGAITMELERLMQAGDQALSQAGLSAPQAESLLSLRPGTSEDARDALAQVARSGLDALRGQLPLTAPGRYVVKREFARGGMGRILVALDTAVGREIALKEVLTPRDRFSQAPGDPSPQAVERFVREAKVTGQLEHPNIVPVYEISRRDDGSIFYTMKLVRGRSMAERLAEIRDSGRPDAEKLSMRLQLIESFLAVCHAIAYAHSRGVIHRDLKPHNVMLGNFGETVVLDWGLARVGAEDPPESAPQAQFSPSLLRQGRDSHTLEGTVIGTPAYMPPEQARGQLELVDEKSDVYSLGAILYELLAGRPPFEGMGADSVLEKVIAGEPAPLAAAAPGAPPDLARLCERAMERERSRRLAGAAALAREVQAFRDGRPLSVYEYSSLELVRRFVARNRAATAVAALAALALALVIVLSLRNVAAERDTARDALARAESEQAQRQALQERQQQERRSLVEARLGAIGQAQEDLARLEPAAVETLAANLAAELRALGPEQRRNRSRTDTAAAAARLLQVAELRARLLELATEPVAGVQEPLLTPPQTRALQDALLENRLLATDLSALNDDFALAELILGGTRGPAPRLDRARQNLSEARTALQKQRAERIGQVLAAIHAGRDPGGASVNAAQVRLYVAEVSAWREEQTTRLLAEPLEALAAELRGAPAGALLDVRKRLEIQFLSEVLLLAGSPAQSVPALAGLMLAVGDEEIMVGLATTLCSIGHEAAFVPLETLLARVGNESLVWTRVRRHVRRVPAPETLPEPVDARAILARATLLADQGHHARALAAVTRLLAFSPDNQQALLLRARVTPGPDGQVNLATHARALDTLLRDHPDLPRALAARGELIQAGQPVNEGFAERFHQGLALLDRAVALAPDDWLVRLQRGRFRSSPAEWSGNQAHDLPGALEDLNRAAELAPRIPEVFRDRAGVLANLGRRAEALADANRSLDLDPDNASLLQMRAALLGQAGDWAGAVRDLTRAIELVPANVFALARRASARRFAGDLAGALADAQALHAQEGDGFPPLFRLRASILEDMGNLAGALADLEHYLTLRPDFPDAEEVKKNIQELKDKMK